jgi:hypothetical protein
MNKILPLLIIGVFILSGFGAAADTYTTHEYAISETIHFSQPTLHGEDTCLSINLPEATAYTWKQDKPLIPVVTKIYTLPFGTQVDSISVDIEKITEQPLTQPLAPAPTIEMISTTFTATDDTPASPLYEDITIYPETRYTFNTGGGLEGNEHVTYLTVSIFPIQYKPQENKIFTAEKATIDIRYSPPQTPITFGDEYDLLIIAPDDFLSALQRLVDHKNDMGIATKLTSLDEIPSTGVDEQESIKYYIKDAIETWGIEYLLLVGAGYEGEELFPNRYAWVPSGGYEQYFPSDLYYADIYDATGGFSSWDDDGDGRYAEYNSPSDNDMAAVDIYPDVRMGRLPANTVAEIDIVIDKIIYYKEHNKMTNEIVQVGGDTFTDDSEGIYEGEFANEAVMDVLPGYTKTQLWASNGQLTKSNIAKGFNSMPDFVDFSGHGSPQSWATHAPDDEGTWLPPATTLSPYTGWLYIDFDVFMVSNSKKFPVVFHNACSNNKYSKAKQSLSWKVLSKNGGGGIAAFGASGIGYGSHGSSEVERLFGWMEVNTYDQIMTNKILGIVWENCITDYYNTFQSSIEDADYKTLLEYSMFADPTVAIQDGDNPSVAPPNRPLLNMLFQLLENHPRLSELVHTLLNI